MSESPSQRDVREQFEAQAAGYVASPSHALGQDLAWLGQELPRLVPAAHLGLDVAAGTGHAALTLAGWMGRVVALDLTPGMLHQGRTLAETRGVANVVWLEGDAQRLPFPGPLFDAVVCRIAAHHFTNPEAAFTEARRVLIEDGVFCLIDNVAPPDGEDLLNQIERLHDPSHAAVYSETGWETHLARAGFSDITKRLAWSTPLVIRDWLQRSGTLSKLPEVLIRIREADPSFRETLQFEDLGDESRFALPKVLWVATS